MEPSFWRERWRTGRIGFHEGKPNERLVRNVGALAGPGGAPPARVLVPLCGKTVDLAFLAARVAGGARDGDRGGAVVGVELVEEAARAFFEEQGLPAHRTQDGPLVRWEGGAIEIVVGDFFDVTRAEIGAFDAFFDRAALVALPAELRPRYVAHLRTLLEPGARGLVVSFEHDADPASPPFSIEERELRALYAGCEVALLESEDLSGPEGALASRGAMRVLERAYRIAIPGAGTEAG